jgi:hypothetical protein
MRLTIPQTISGRFNSEERRVKDNIWGKTEKGCPPSSYLLSGYGRKQGGKEDSPSGESYIFL